ncbi:MAG: 4-hydroxybenzoate octaprenyltransferase [Hydrotalea sp.]|nr:4-hydroxybenzoate octaprenyltransferase [Hydrotalea sp.]
MASKPKKTAKKMGKKLGRNQPKKPAKNWLFAITPKWWHDDVALMRLDRPIGVWLLLLPCFWGLAIYHQGFSFDEFIYYGLVFTAGAFALRSAGCIWNDILDREFDKKVARTRDRPLASGRLSLDHAIWLMSILLLIGFVVLLLIDSKQSHVVALLSLGLVAPYPLMKRMFLLPQLWLGFTFNIGVLVAGMLTTNNYFDLGLWWLYLIGVLWTVAYDTIYALQDKDDDFLLGLHTSTLVFGGQVKHAIGICYLLMTALLVGLFIYLDSEAIVGYGFLGLAVLAMAHSYRRITEKKSEANLQNFRWQWLIGVLIFLALYYR